MNSIYDPIIVEVKCDIHGTDMVEYLSKLFCPICEEEEERKRIQTMLEERDTREEF